MKYKNLTFLFTILFLTPVYLNFNLFAEDHPQTSLTLSGCINYALRYNPTIKSSKEYVKAERAYVQSSKSFLFPHIYSYGGISRYGDISKQNSFKNEYYSTIYSGRLNISQTIFNLSSIKNLNYTKELLKSRKYYSESTIQNVILSVKLAFYEALKTQQEIKIAEENLNLINKFLNNAKSLYIQNKCSEYDISFARIDSMNAKINLNLLKNDLKQDMSYLIEQIGYSELIVSSIKEELIFSPYRIDLDSTIKKALTNRPDYKASLSEIASRKADVSANYASLLPTLSMGGGVDFYKREVDYDYLNKGWNIGLNMSFPIFDGFRVKANIDRAKAYLSAYRHNSEKLKQRIIREIKYSYFSLNEIEKNYRVSEQMVNEALKKYQLSITRYQSGKGSPLEVSNSIGSLINARKNLVYYLIYHKSTVALLKNAMGIL